MKYNKLDSVFSTELIDGSKFSINEKVKLFLLSKDDEDLLIAFVVLDKESGLKNVTICFKSDFYNNVYDLLVNEGKGIESKIIDFKYLEEGFLCFPADFFISCGIDKNFVVEYLGYKVCLWNPALYIKYDKKFRKNISKDDIDKFENDLIKSGHM